ncbi:MAG: hypothetical protein WC969_11415 [Elusimicrobiota bacterium]
MPRLFLTLLALVPLVLPAPLLAADELESALRRRFAGEDESWMLDAILSDGRQLQAFVKEGGAASRGDEAAQRDFELRWRKKLVGFAEQYHRHLTTHDILPDAPSVEKMITEYEFNVTNHWLMAQPKAVQEAALKDIADGNAVLGLFRGTVEKRVRAKRKAAAQTIGKYLLTAPAREALAYVPPPPKPPETVKPPVVAEKPPVVAAKPPPKPAAKPEVRAGTEPEPPAVDAAALEELRRAEAEARAASAASEAETASRQAGKAFGGAAPMGGSVAAPTDASMGLARPLPNAGLLAAPEPGASQGGGFVVNAPPTPFASRDSVVRSSPGKVIMERIVPAAAGAVLGGLAGFFLGGPFGLLAGLLVGAAAGYLLTKK